jgi:hypothetical protein
MKLRIAGLLLLGSMSAWAQVSTEEAKARLEAKQRAAASQPVDRAELDRLRRENATLKAEVAKLKEQIASIPRDLGVVKDAGPIDQPSKEVAAAIKAKKVLKGMTLAQVQSMFLTGPVKTTEGPGGTTYVFQAGFGEKKNDDGSIFMGNGLERNLHVLIRDGKVVDFTDRKGTAINGGL